MVFIVIFNGHCLNIFLKLRHFIGIWFLKIAGIESILILKTRCKS